MASANAVDGKQPNKRHYPKGTNDHSDSNNEVPIRTVYIGGITPFCTNEINRDFSPFGEIESVSMQFDDARTQWCLVQFKRQEDAKEALLRTGNRWHGHDVRAADPWHQPDHPLQVAPDQDSDSNISVVLNDDCLQAIFERLKPSCLTNVAGVCKRFNEKAKKTFALKHKHLDLSFEFYRQHDLIEVIKHFGKSIQSLRIRKYSFQTEADTIHLIGQYCGPSLKQLEFRGFKFPTDALSLRPIFSQIEELKLYDCSSSIGLRELLTGCGELILISLSHCQFWAEMTILEGTFPKLQEFSFNGLSLNDGTFEDFVIRHPTLLKLSIDCMQFTPRLLPAIGQYAKHLQELKLDENHYCDPFVSTDSIVSMLRALVASQVPIESLEILITCQPDDDQAIKCISLLKRIKMLRLSICHHTSVTNEDFVELAGCLPELVELHLQEHRPDWRFRPDYNFNSKLSSIDLRKMLIRANKLKSLKLRSIDGIKIDVDYYNAMLDVIQKRKDPTPLVIEVYGQANQIDVPAAVLTENRSTLNIRLTR